jgi:hypothetical protein
MKLTVKVEQEHIDEGRARDALNCPIARALNEQHPRPGDWAVHKDEVWAFGTNRTLRPSRRAKRFIRDVDAKKPVRPSTFILTDEVDI